MRFTGTDPGTSGDPIGDLGGDVHGPSRDLVLHDAKQRIRFPFRYRGTPALGVALEEGRGERYRVFDAAVTGWLPESGCACLRGFIFGFLAASNARASFRPVIHRPIDPRESSTPLVRFVSNRSIRETKCAEI